MDIFVARQPIFNVNMKTYGYELLFRDSLDNFFPEIDGDTASSAVLANSFLCIGMEQLTSGKKAFVNFTRNLLVKQVPCLFSKEIIIPEVLENILPDPEVLSAIAAMVGKGYKFALDDFVFDDVFEPLIQRAAIIKIDIRATPLPDAKKLIDRLTGRPVKFLAEKVETRQEFIDALHMGFSYFQGFFFSEPEIVQRRTISPSKIKMLQIIGEANREDADIDRLENLIKPDLSISYWLLRYMNSAYFNRPSKIASIKEAILFLGLTEVRKLVTLIAASKMADSKPNELIRTSIMRAKLCELAGEASAYAGDNAELFLLGLFSLMDAILDVEMAKILEHLPLSPALKAALIREEGELACCLKLVRCYERGLWEDCPELGEDSRSFNLTMDKYVEAIGWADALTFGRI